MSDDGFVTVSSKRRGRPRPAAAPAAPSTSTATADDLIKLVDKDMPLVEQSALWVQVKSMKPLNSCSTK